MSNPAQDNLNVLSFKMAPYVFGDTIIYMQLTDHRLTPKNTTYEIIVRVLPINDRPSFEIVTEIIVAEAGGSDAPTATITCSGGCSSPSVKPHHLWCRCNLGHQEELAFGFPKQRQLQMAYCFYSCDKSVFHILRFTIKFQFIIVWHNFLRWYGPQNILYKYRL